MKSWLKGLQWLQERLANIIALGIVLGVLQIFENKYSKIKNLGWM